MTDFWTDERVALLRERAPTGISFAEIGIELGCTRNAAIGKARRLKIKVPKKPKAERKPRPTTRAKRKMQLKSRIAAPPAPRPPCILAGLDAHTCRWPLWEARTPENEKFYCAAWTLGIEFNQPYCAKHAALAFWPATPSRSFVSYVPNRK